MKEVEILGMKIRYDEECITIFNSYEINNEDHMWFIFKELIVEHGYRSKRSVESWIREWKAHNRLYRLGLFKEHTKDCDLEENEKWYRRLAYWFIGF